MSFTPYLINKFDTTHENIFFKQFSAQLEKQFKEQNGEHVLIGNFSCGGHAMDAIFLSNGQISVIDFKDYGGDLTFTENNEWKLKGEDGKIEWVKGGGNRRNPYQQVNAYRWTLLKVLESNQEKILEKLRPNEINWGHVGAIVLFHKDIRTKQEEIPERISNYFHITDFKKSGDLLDSITSQGLVLTDNEISSIVSVLDIQPENLLSNFNIVDESKASEGRPSPLIVKEIEKAAAEYKNTSDVTRLIKYYHTLVSIERYKEPKADNLSAYPLVGHGGISEYNLDLTANPQFFQYFLKNKDERFPKSLFIALKVVIDGEAQPLLHTVKSPSEFAKLDPKNIWLDFNEFELYRNELEQRGLPEEAIDELTAAIYTVTTLEEKLACISEHLNVSAELGSNLLIGLANESMYTAQLQSELKKLLEMPDAKITNQNLVSFLKRQSSACKDSTLSLEPLIQITPLNEAQSRAVRLGFQQPLTVITGPPGTGKTQVVMNIIANAVTHGHSVLFASKNNKAIDNVVERFSNLLNEPYLIRMGSKNEIQDNAKPTIDQFLRKKSSGQFNDQSAALDAVKQRILDNAKEIKSITEKIASIPDIEKAKNDAELKLDEHEKVHDFWLKSIDQDERSFFVEKSLSMNIDNNALGFALNKATSGSKNSVNKMLFNLLHKSSAVRKVEELNKNQAPALYSYISEKAPYFTEEHVAVSLKNNLEFLKRLKESEVTLKNKQRDFTTKLSTTRATVESKSRRLQELLSQKEADLARIEKLEAEQTELGRQIVNLTIENDLFSMSSAGIQHYKDSIPTDYRDDANTFRNYCKEFLKTFKTVCLTSLSIKNSFSLDQELFDILVIDEASQCDIASALPMILRAKRVVVIGDPLQLSHITNIRREEEKYLIELLKLQAYQLNYSQNSLFDLSQAVSVLSQMESVFLDEHYRCHPEIIGFSNDKFYQQNLGQTMKIKTRVADLKFNAKGLLWKHVRGQVDKDLKRNVMEAKECVEIARTLANKYPDASIGIITPFRDQCEYIGSLLEGDRGRFKPDTVHRYQGDEKDIIIYSLVVSGDNSDGRSNFIDRNPNLMNVAMTRARSTIYIVGNHEYCKMQKGAMNSLTPLSSLAYYAVDKGKVF